MGTHALAWIFAAETVVLGVVAILLPRITRRGLLFGVYVGEAAHDRESARKIRRAWSAGIAMATVVCAGAAVALAFAGAHPGVLVLPELALLAIGAVLYLRAYRAAGEVVGGGVPIAPLPDVRVAHAGTVLPWLAVGLSIVLSAALTAVAASRYDALPDRVPIHFNAAGQADGFAPKGFGSVFALPVITGLMGLFLGGIAILVARTRPALRAGDGGVSIVAQIRFRAATARFLSGTAILIVAMLASLSVFSLRVAGGAAPGLPAKFLLWAFAIVAWTFGGVIYLFARYGQGGSRLEGATPGPLADGLADNRRWWLGVIYVNRDDPSWLVEKRFGLGYTINFGNPKAIAALAVFLIALVALVIIAAG